MYLQSTLFSDSIPLFLIKIYNDLRYETFHLGVKVYVTSSSRKRVSKLDTWSRLKEALWFLIIREVDQKLKVLQGQFDAMRATPIEQKVYSAEIIIRALSTFVHPVLYILNFVRIMHYHPFGHSQGLLSMLESLTKYVCM